MLQLTTQRLAKIQLANAMINNWMLVIGGCQNRLIQKCNSFAGNDMLRCVIHIDHSSRNTRARLSVCLSVCMDVGLCQNKHQGSEWVETWHSCTPQQYSKTIDAKFTTRQGQGQGHAPY